MRGDTRRYLAWLGASFVSLLLAAALLSLFVDPYRLFHLRAALDDRFARPRAAQQVRLVKTYGIAYVGPRTLVLGNSRAEIGLDPHSPSWPADWRPVFNAAIPGSGLASDVRTFARALREADVRHIVVGVEFLDFPTSPDEPVDDSPATLRDESRLRTMRERLQTLFTVDGVIDSLATLRALHDPDAADITADGFNPLHEYRTYARREGYAALFEQREAEYASRLARLPHDVFRRGTQTSRSWRDLERLLALAAQHGVTVELVIYPYHARLLELFRKAGLWPAFDTWKRHLVEVVAAHPRLRGERCALWDFSGYHTYARERVPPRGDRHSEVPSYWEAGHFKSTLGDRMLARMLGGAAGDASFGQCLTKDTVDDALQRIDAERDAYAATVGAGIKQLQ